MPSTRLPKPRPYRRIHLHILRLGLGMVLLAGLALAITSFALFGCQCSNAYTLREATEPAPAPEPAAPQKTPAPSGQ